MPTNPDPDPRLAPPASETQLGKVRAHLCRLARAVTKTPPSSFSYQVVRRDRDNGDIEYQIFADTPKGTQIAWVQSTKHDADFIAACLAQAPLFEELLRAEPPPAPPAVPLCDPFDDLRADGGLPEAAEFYGKGFDFRAHLERQRAFSERTFGPGARTAGVVDHIRKELREIEAEPGDLREWIDVVILALDGAWRAGFNPDEIIDSLVTKQARNEARTWPDWRTAPTDKAIEHQRGEAEREAASPPPSKCRLCEKAQPCPEHGRTPITPADFDELSQFVAVEPEADGYFASPERYSEYLNEREAAGKPVYVSQELLKAVNAMARELSEIDEAIELPSDVSDEEAQRLRLEAVKRGAALASPSSSLTGWQDEKNDDDDQARRVKPERSERQPTASKDTKGSGQ